MEHVQCVPCIIENSLTLSMETRTLGKSTGSVMPPSPPPPRGRRAFSLSGSVSFHFSLRAFPYTGRKYRETEAYLRGGGGGDKTRAGPLCHGAQRIMVEIYIFISSKCLKGIRDYPPDVLRTAASLISGLRIRIRCSVSHLTLNRHNCLAEAPTRKSHSVRMIK